MPRPGRFTPGKETHYPLPIIIMYYNWYREITIFFPEIKLPEREADLSPPPIAEVKSE
jgi:hypothetical protein